MKLKWNCKNTGYWKHTVQIVINKYLFEFCCVIGNFQHNYTMTKMDILPTCQWMKKTWEMLVCKTDKKSHLNFERTQGRMIFICFNLYVKMHINNSNKYNTF